MNELEYKERLILLNKIHSDVKVDSFLQQKHQINEYHKFISKVFVEPNYTLTVMRIFKSVLPFIASYLVENSQEFSSDFEEMHNKITFALTKTLPFYPNFINYIIQHLEKRPPLLEKIFKKEKTLEKEKWLELIKTAYQLLSVAPLEFSKKWNWSPIYTLLQSTDKEISWYASRCLSILLKCEYKVTDFDNSNELEKFLKETEEVHYENTLLLKEKGSDLLQQSDSSIVNICGVLMNKKSKPKDPQLIYTKTTIENMKNLATAVNQGNYVLLEGTTGSSKTGLVEELSRLTGNNDLIKVHLDESFDSKDLLGTYVCTDVPGEFIWQNGALIKAMSEGRWILIEDIDLASFDVISSLIPLIESNSLFLSSRDEVVQAKSGFKMFSTQCLVETFSNIPKRQKNIPMLSLWNKVYVQQLPVEEIKVVLEEKFKSIKTLIPRFIETYERLIGAKEEENKEMLQYKLFGRKFSLRDLIKWCERVFVLYGGKIRGDYILSDIKEDIFNEARDCFCGMIIKKNIYQGMVASIAQVWDISPDRLAYFHDYYKPNIQESKGNLAIGRIAMKRLEKEGTLNLSKKFNFAHTKHSLRLLEKISSCVQMNEPVLLTGETGTGKTSNVQYLAALLGVKLIVHNLNQQTDSSDFIGGYKPVDLKILASALKKNFEKLFSFTFSMKSNEKFLSQISTAYNEKDYEKFISLISSGIEKAHEKLEIPQTDEKSPKKPKQMNQENQQTLKNYWNHLEEATKKFARQQNLVKNSFAFSFVEGSLVTALKEGHWILLDEINLASTETLERLSGLIEGKDGTLFITEKGDTEPIKRHPNFRLFACMNPPTDIGKKNLPPSLKSRFTEFYVHELDDREDLKVVVRRYLEGSITEPPVDSIVDFFLEAKRQAETNLSDGSNQKPSYSLRTLSRALEYTIRVLNTYGVERSLYEGLCMSFLTQLNSTSIPIMEGLIVKYILKKTNPNELNSVPKCPGKEFVQFEHFWIKQGQYKIEDSETYIQTPTVQENLKNLARIIVSYKYPILLQGPTSAGKTSMVKYLAQRTGHRFVRINNHETTDLQEYFGTYITNSEGKLIFKEGILVEAVRNGYWIVLDELNLAPSDILEGLNRLLDDNRELFIPETQEVIKPHPHFQLFATQNPPGLYGGRKVLSRAFRNRFMELQVDDIPGDELIEILQKRCQIPKTFATNMVAVMKDLQAQRQKSQIFAGKTGFITPRDLFRWAERLRNVTFSKMDLAEIGYQLLAERLRRDDEKEIVKDSIETHILGKPKGKKSNSEFKNIDLEKMYNFKTEKELEELSKLLGTSQESFTNIIWTKSMKRLYALVGNCIKNQEPVLLVGETGCGKTTICQLYSFIRKQHLHVLNCHQHTETSDFLGSLRPVRGREQLKVKILQMIKELKEKSKKFIKKLDFDDINNFEDSIDRIQTAFSQVKKNQEFAPIQKLLDQLLDIHREYISLFHWYDGPLVTSMKHGDVFLIDEISLADDAVLERLNSVLEPERTLVLPEKGGEAIDEIIASDKFLILATMNPGGDFGKRELSPALRNRFTEIYVPSLSYDDDLMGIINEKLHKDLRKKFSTVILNFIKFFKNLKSKKTITVRDIISWIDFLGIAHTQLKMEDWESYLHGAQAIFLDGLGVGMDSSERTRLNLKKKCEEFLFEQIPENIRKKVIEKFSKLSREMEKSKEDKFGFHPFYIAKGNNPIPKDLQYSLSAPTTNHNTIKLLRAMQLSKPILLEGSPGVGKTSLVLALAKASGQNVVRINLSEQTDMMDLLGTDLPVEGSSGGEFTWSDGIFLRALKAGDWVLLDELNLASQSVLEGLNSVLDHRSEIYIPELNKTFSCPKKFRIFASQNPLQQGGGRKGLPKSFLNRFTKVYVDELNKDDLLFITMSIHGEIGQENLLKMIEFNQQMHIKTMVEHTFGRKGSPWEFNLRDVFRWCEMLKSDDTKDFDPSKYVDCIYRQRMRTPEDRQSVIGIYESIFGKKIFINEHPSFSLSNKFVQIGSSQIPKNFNNSSVHLKTGKKLSILHSFLNPLENIMKCVELNYMTIITGPSSSGKSSLVRLLADITENDLNEFSMSGATDTVELLGGFEQVDPSHKRKMVAKIIEGEIYIIARYFSQKPLMTKEMDNVKQIYNEWHNYSTNESSTNLEYENQKLKLLEHIATKVYSIATQFKIELTYSLDDIKNQLSKIEQLNKDGVKGRFEWKDGIVIRSLEMGHWILIDNVNFCSPTVLDRLNSLLEPGGVLVVNERGTIDGEIKIVKPHKNFRVFMLMDPKYGEISRAMRNRGIEISLFSIPIPSQDAITLLSDIGVPNVHISELLCQYHDQFLKTIHLSEDERPTLRDLLRSGEILTIEAKHRDVLMEATKHAIDSVYIRNRLMSSSDKETATKLLEKALSEFNTLDKFKYPSSFLINNSFNTSNYMFNTMIREGSFLLNLAFLSMNQDIIKGLEKNPLNTKQLQSQFKDLPKNSLLELPENILDVFMGRSNKLSKSFNEISNLDVTKLMEYSSYYFIEKSSNEDLQVRKKWLSILGQYFGHDQTSSRIFKKVLNIMDKLSNSSLWKDITKRRKEYLKIELQMPLDLRMNDSIYQKFSSYLNTSDYLLFEKLRVFTSRLFTQFDESEFYQKTLKESFVEEKVNLLQRSLWFYSHKDQRSRVASKQKIILLFYPFFLEFDKFIEKYLLQGEYQDISLEKFEEILESRDRFWKYLYTEKSLSEKILIFWNWFQKSIDTRKIGDLTILIKEMNENMNQMFPNSYTKNTLWKNGGKPNILNNPELLKSKEEIEEFDSQWKKVGESEINNLMIKGMATILWVTTQGNEINQDYISKLGHPLSELPLKLKEKSTSIVPKKKAEEQQLDDILYQFVKKKESTVDSFEALFALFDHKSMLNELTLISEIQEYNHHLLKNDKVKPESLLEKSTSLLEFVSSNTSRSPLDMVPYQVLNWKLSENKLDQKTSSLLIQEILMKWNNRIWDNNYNKFKNDTSKEISFETLEGPPKLFQDVKAIRILQLLSDWNQIPMRYRFTKIEQLEKIKEFLVSNDRQVLPLEADWKRLTFSFLNTLIYFKKTFIESDYHKLLETLDSVLKFIEKSFDKQLKEKIKSNLNLSIQKSNDERFKGCTEEILEILDLILSKNEKEYTHEEICIILGKAWSLFGVLKIHLIIPAQALDPTLKYKVESDFIKESINETSEKKDIYSRIEKFITGGDTNHQIRSLEEESQNLLVVSNKIERKMIQRPSDTPFLEVYRDLLLFTTSYVEKSKMKTLMKSIEKMEKNIFNQEDLWQENTTQLLKKISRYQGFEDISTPFITAGYDIKYGLRLLSFGVLSNTKSDSHIHQLIQLLLQFPSSNSVESLSQISEHITNIIKETSKDLVEYDRFLILLKIIQSLLSKAYINVLHTNLNPENLKSLDNVFSVYANMWTVISEELEKKKIEKENLFKYKEKVTEILSDEQIIENEVNSLFPSFNEDYLDLLDSFEQQQTVKKENKSDIERIEKLLSSPDGLEMLTTIHSNIFSSQKGQNLDELRSKLFDVSFDAAKSLMSKTKKQYSFKSSDTLSLLFNASKSLNRLKEKIDQVSEKKVYDFYVDENIPEVGIAFNVVSQIVQKSFKLLEKYEENPVLAHIIQIAERVLSFAISSPLAKVINGLELLLRKASEWEQFLTSPTGSMRNEISSLSALIIRWRKNELGNWKSIFATRTKQFASKSYPFWFKFYQFVNLSNVKDEKFYEDFYNVVDDFIRSSSFGEFKTRISIIMSLCDQITVENNLGYKREQNEEFRANVANILYNIIRFYEQFSFKLESTIESEMKPLEQKLVDFVKIMKWNDTNINGIQQATEKARKKLAKFSTEYQHILQRATRDLWDKQSPFEQPQRPRKNQEELDIVAKVVDTSKTLFNSKIETIKPHQVLDSLFKINEKDSNLNPEKSSRLLSNISNVIEKFILNGEGIQLSNYAINYIEDLSTSIIEQTIKLKKSEKVNVKQRALTNLLSELKEIGVSHLLKPLKDKTTIQNIMLLPKVDEVKHVNEESSEMWKSADEYFYKNVYLLQTLRYSYNNHHENIQKEANKMMGYAENLFFLTMKQRKMIHFISTEMKEIDINLAKMNIEFGNVKGDIGFIPPQNFVKTWIEKQKTLLSHYTEILEELRIVFNTVKGKEPKLDTVVSTLSNCLKPLKELSINKLYTFKEYNLLETNFKQIQEVNQVVIQIVSTSKIPNCCDQLHKVIQDSVQLAKQFNVDFTVIKEQDQKEKSNVFNHDKFIEEFKQNYDKIIFRIKISVQNIKELNEKMKTTEKKEDKEKEEKDDEEEEKEEDPLRENVVQNLRSHFVDSFKFIKLQELNQTIKSLIQTVIDFSNEDVYSSSRKMILDYCARLMKNLKTHLSYLQSLINVYQVPFLFYHKSLSKLEYILLSTFLTLFKEGYCVREEEEGEAGEGEIEFSEGTGLDEGEGITDVSKEIENEDQVLNNDDMKKQDNQKDLSENKEEGIEMENDFQGEYYDDEKEEKQEENQEEEGDELDDEMGELDNEDQEVLDKKLWDDENEKEDREEKSDGKDNQNNPEEEESEIKGKEEEGDEKDSKEKNQKEDKKKKPKNVEEGDEQDPNEEEEEEQVDQGDFNDQFQEGEQEQPENEGDEPYKLPEELNIQDENMEEEEGEENDEEKEGEEEIEEDNPDAVNPDGKENDEQTSENIETEEVNQERIDEDEKEEGEEEGNEEEEDDTKSKGIDNAVEEQGDENEHPEKDEEEKGDKSEDEEDKEAAYEEDLKQTPYGVKESIGKPSEIKDENEEKDSEETSLNPQEESGKDTNKEEFGENYEKGQDNSKEPPKAKQTKFDPNPERNLGDALKEWKNKLEIVDSKKEKEQDVIEEDEESKDEVGDKNEFGDNNDDNQTIGPATEEQSEQFPPLDKEEEDEEEEGGKDEMELEDKHEEFEQNENKEAKKETKEKKKDNENIQNVEEKMKEKKKENIKQEQVEFEKSDFKSSIKTSSVERNLTTETIIEKELTIDDISKMREELDEMLSKWRDSKDNIEKAKELWKKFDLITSSLSQELCEQLRLILEPTLATKMKGDYKTGKRINMKKVITYIASQFRKDKIWLRRTKPNKRQYQVLVAIDDSRSMSKNNAGSLACEAVVLLCKAMSQLEVGELAVLKFGENVQLLHPFDRPFTDESGSEILAQFTFDQKQTQIAQLLNYQVQMLELYKNFSSFRNNEEQVQLSFIISDGRLLERENIVKIVREAHSKRQLIVFILIDNLNEKESVLEMKTISYPNNKLTIQSYIDQFPFPYYIILKDIHSLPEILADALRQWFELIQNIQE